MKSFTFVLLALLAVVAVNGRTLQDHADNATTLDPALKDAFGATVYESLLALPQQSATALAGSVINGTQLVCWYACRCKRNAQRQRCTGGRCCLWGQELQRQWLCR